MQLLSWFLYTSRWSLHLQVDDRNRWWSCINRLMGVLVCYGGCLWFLLVPSISRWLPALAGAMGEWPHVCGLPGHAVRGEGWGSDESLRWVGFTSWLTASPWWFLCSSAVASSRWFFGKHVFWGHPRLPAKASKHQWKYQKVFSLVQKLISFAMEASIRFRWF